MAEEPTKPETDETTTDEIPAQDPPEPVAVSEPPEPVAASEPGVSDPLTLSEAQSWLGFRLDDLGGSTVGKVEGVYVDDNTSRPEWLLARMGRFGHHCLVPARDAVAANGHVWVPYSRDLIRKAPRIEPGDSLELDGERALLEHYGVGTAEVGRGADLTGRDAGAVTARPA